MSDSTPPPSDPSQQPTAPPPPAATPPPAAGYPQAQPPATAGGAIPGQKSKLVAGLLGIFVGSFGIHRFYLGYTGIGVAQILVTIFTCGIGGLWGFIEGIMILVGSESFRTDANGVPLAE